MAAAASAQARSAARGPRPVDVKRDMLPLADLLELVFGPELDSAGRQLVRDMRALGRFGWLGGVLSRLMLPPAAAPRGYVWEESGRIIGNASLLPVTGHAKRWVLANVVVHPDFRRRGIGRELVEACLGLARSRGIGTLMLQVKVSNPEAERLYLRLGFRKLTARTTWVRLGGAASAPGLAAPEVRRRVSGEWSDQWALAQRLYPEGLVWPNPLHPGAFRPAWREALHWVWYRGGQLWGSLTALPRGAPRHWRLILLAQPEAAGQVEAALLGRALASLPVERSSMILDYPAGAALTPLQLAGFRSEKSLTWMERRLDSEQSRGSQDG
ncbi:MAG TPA: GNAT family N-acetyltransferase [Anaerolineales bacterium]